MMTRVDLTLDCANPRLLAAFWKTAAVYVDEPPPPAFATREDLLARFHDEFDDGMDGAPSPSRGATTCSPKSANESSAKPTAGAAARSTRPGPTGAGC